MADPGGGIIIERYGPDGFCIGGRVYTDPVIILPSGVMAWPIGAGEAITLEQLAPIAAHGGVEILLLGTGRRLTPVPAAIRAGLRLVGIAVDSMDSFAACRTFAVLSAERRRVAAALLPARFR